MTSRLLEPLVVRGRPVPARVLFGPHETNLGAGRALSGRHVAYYAARAAGGTGALVVETASVTPDDWPSERAPLAELCGTGWSAVARACAPHGTLVLAGLGHRGGQGSSLWSQDALRAPSAVPDVASREVPAALEPDEIGDVVAAFAAAASGAVAAGLAGVEVDAGARSLIRQFWSPMTNQRDDDYGRDRLLLLRQVLAAVRRALGDDGVLALRLSGDELVPSAGITPAAAVAAVAELAPLLDLLVATVGGPYRPQAARPDGHTPAQGNGTLNNGTLNNEALAARLRSAVRSAGCDTLVVLQGSVVDPVAADRALAAGAADLVEMTRAQVADPELVAKLRAGRPEQVRPCVLCNQDCAVSDTRNPIVSCVGEPRSGYETLEPPVPRRVAGSTGRPVLVVGGGPAGLEAARVLALGGRRVVLAERTARLGGLLPVVATLPGRDRFARLLSWWERELRRLDVEIRLGVDVEPGGPAPTDDVVLALGSVPGPPPFPVDSGHVVEAAAVLAAVAAGTPLPVRAGPVLVDDPLGGPAGVGVAERLAAAGHLVEIATPDLVVGRELARSGDLADAAGRLARAGVRCRTSVRLRRVTAAGAELEDVWTGARTTVAAGTVVSCGHRAAALAAPDPRAVGDAVAPRTVGSAVLEGRRAAQALLARPKRVDGLSGPAAHRAEPLVPAGARR